MDRYRAALDADPGRALTRSNLGNVLKRAGCLDEAVAELARAVEIEPGFAEGWSNLGLAEKERRNFDAALAAFARAEALDPTVAAFPYNAANTLAAAGRRDEAIQVFHHVLTIAPDHPGAIANLGAALRQSGQLDMALPQVPDWRWGLEGERTVWYPTLHVFRQRQRGDWDQVFGDIREALGARIGVHG